MNAAVKASMAFLTTCLTAAPADAFCSAQTLRGNYAFTVQGNALSPEGAVVALINGVGIVAFDGVGNLIQEDFIVFNGVQSPGGPTNPSGFHTGETGTYSVNADCTGSTTLVLGPGNSLGLAFVIAGNGATVHTVVASGTVNGSPALFQTRSDMERIPLQKKNGED